MNKQNFNLTKAKLLPAGGLEVSYQLTEVIGDEATTTDYTATHNRDVHPDLAEAFQGMAGTVAERLGLLNFEKLRSSIQPKDKGLVDELIADVMDSIEVRGVAWSGSGAKRGVVITSVLTTPNGQKTALNTPRLTVSEDDAEGAKLVTALDTLNDEVFAYLFEGKQAQLSLFGDNQEPDNPTDGQE